MMPSTTPGLALLSAALFFSVLAASGGAQDVLRTHAGSAHGAGFGTSISRMDDVNGDNISDFVIGMAEYDSSTNGLEVGGLRVISGATGATIRTHIGTEEFARLGQSVSALADVNGDGVGDYMAGAPYSDINGNDSGFVRRYSGATGATIDTLNGPGAEALFGMAVTNRSGSFIVGAPGTNNGTGTVYVFTNLGTLVDSMNGIQAGEWFGASLTTGHFYAPGQDDGVLDFAIGAPFYNSGQILRVGRMEVRNGTPPYNSLFGKIGPLEPWTFFGFSLAGLGTIEAGACDGLIVGAHGADPTDPGQAFVYVYTTTKYTKTGSENGSQFGFAVGAAGDVNGDGLNDFLIGAPLETANGNQAGRARLYSGATGNVLNTILGSQTFERMGEALAGGSNLNNAGNDDYVVCATGWDGTGIDAGRARAVLSNNGFLWTVEGPVRGDRAGSSVAGVGDVNMDGYPDYIYGLPEADGPGGSFSVQRQGRVEVRSGLTGAFIRDFDGDQPNDAFGAAVAACGDVNLDGVPDFAVGAPKTLGASSGLAYVQVFSGSNGAVLFTFNGTHEDDHFGSAISAGDVNGNAYPDVVVGAPSYTAGGLGERGQLRAFSGFSGAVLWSRTGNAAGDRFGESCAVVGDATGDNRGDVVVGAPFADPNGASSGEVYLLSGLNGAVIHTIEGSTAGDRCGSAVTRIGDINNDGRADFVATHPFYGAGTIEGRVRAYSGATGNILKTYVTSDADSTGLTAVSIGDVDLDGFEDLLLGGTLNILGVVSDFAEILSGGTFTRSDLFSLGVNGDDFASALGAAGDTNLDGIPDLLIGAPGANNPMTDSGTVYLVSGRPSHASFYGVGTLGCQGTQLLTVNQTPEVGGNDFRFGCNNVPPSTLGLLLVSDTQDFLGTFLPDLGIRLHVDIFSTPDVSSYDIVSNELGFGSLEVPIPNVPALAGNDYYCQAIWYWSNACVLGPLNLSSSRGLRLTIQP